MSQRVGRGPQGAQPFHSDAADDSLDVFGQELENVLNGLVDDDHDHGERSHHHAGPVPRSTGAQRDGKARRDAKPAPAHSGASNVGAGHSSFVSGAPTFGYDAATAKRAREAAAGKRGGKAATAATAAQPPRVPPGYAHGWLCAACGFGNAPQHEECIVCGDSVSRSRLASDELYPVPQPPATSTPPPAAPAHAGHGSKGVHTAAPASVQVQGKKSVAAPAPAPVAAPAPAPAPAPVPPGYMRGWECGACGLPNPVNIHDCYACGDHISGSRRDSEEMFTVQQAYAMAAAQQASPAPAPAPAAPPPAQRTSAVASQARAPPTAQPAPVPARASTSVPSASSQKHDPATRSVPAASTKVPESGEQKGAARAVVAPPAPPVPAGHYACLACSFHNRAESAVCDICNTPRPASVHVPKAAPAAPAPPAHAAGDAGAGKDEDEDGAGGSKLSPEERAARRAAKKARLEEVRRKAQEEQEAAARAKEEEEERARQEALAAKRKKEEEKARLKAEKEAKAAAEAAARRAKEEEIARIKAERAAKAEAERRAAEEAARAVAGEAAKKQAEAKARCRKALPPVTSPNIAPPGTDAASAGIISGRFAECVLPNGSVVAGWVMGYAPKGPEGSRVQVPAVELCEYANDGSRSSIPEDSLWYNVLGSSRAWAVRTIQPRVDTGEDSRAAPRPVAAWLFNQVSTNEENGKRIFRIPKHLDVCAGRDLVVALSDGSVLPARILSFDDGRGSLHPPALYAAALGRGIGYDKPVTLVSGTTLAIGHPLCVPLHTFVLPSKHIEWEEGEPPLPVRLEEVASGRSALKAAGCVPLDRVLPLGEWVAVPVRARPAAAASRTAAAALPQGGQDSTLWVGRVVGQDRDTGLTSLHSGTQAMEVDLRSTGALWLRAPRAAVWTKKEGGYYPGELEARDPADEPLSPKRRPGSGYDSEDVSCNVVMGSFCAGLLPSEDDIKGAPGCHLPVGYPLVLDDQEGILLGGVVRAWHASSGLYEVSVPGEEVARIAKTRKEAPPSVRDKCPLEAGLPARDPSYPCGYAPRTYFARPRDMALHAAALMHWARRGHACLDVDETSPFQLEASGLPKCPPLPPADGTLPISAWAAGVLPSGGAEGVQEGQPALFLGKVASKTKGEGGKVYYVLHAPAAGSEDGVQMELPGRYVASLAEAVATRPLLHPLNQTEAKKAGAASAPLLMPLGVVPASKAGASILSIVRSCMDDPSAHPLPPTAPGPIPAGFEPLYVRVLGWRPQAGAWLTGTVSGGRRAGVGMLEVHVHWDACLSTLVERAFTALAAGAQGAGAGAQGAGAGARPAIVDTFVLDETAHARAVEGLLAMPTIMPHISA